MTKRINYLILFVLSFLFVGIFCAKPAHAMTTMTRLYSDEVVCKSGSISRNLYYSDGVNVDKSRVYSDRLDYELTTYGDCEYVLYIHKGTSFYDGTYSTNCVTFYCDASGKPLYCDGKIDSPTYIDNGSNYVGLQYYAQKCVIEEGVTSIPGYTFYTYEPKGLAECHITDWYMPDSLTYINPAFEGQSHSASQVTFHCSYGSYAAKFAKAQGYNIVYTKLNTPKLSKAANTSTGVKVTWESVAGMTSSNKYKVYRKVSGGSWSALGTTSSTSYTDTTAVNGKTYYYTVKVVNANDGSSMSSYNKTGKKIVRLSAPTGLKTTNTTSGVKVSWSAVSGADGYYVYRSKDNGETYSKIQTVSSTSMTDTNAATSGKKYCYRIYAYKTSGSSTYKSAYASKNTIYVGTPAISSVSSSTAGKTAVKWSAVSNASGYEIMYSKSSSFSGAKTVSVTSGSTVSKTLSTPSSGSKYYVKIRSYKKTSSGAKYCSAWSSAKSVTAK